MTDSLFPEPETLFSEPEHEPTVECTATRGRQAPGRRRSRREEELRPATVQSTGTDGGRRSASAVSQHHPDGVR